MPEKLYSIKESTMTNMADTIRSITGTTGPISGDEVASYVVTNLPNAKNPVLQEKTVSPSTSSQTVTPDSNYDGLSKVTVNAMPTATQATPSITVNASGLITASATQAAGYVSAGTKSGTKQLATQSAKTITPSTSSQTAVASGVYTTGAVTVAAIPSSYVKPTTTKTATTYTPTTSNQTIAAGTYCSGAQTIKGDSNLVAANIKKGVSIFGITGMHEGGEDLTSVISEQATLISQLETALENKASGGSGGSMETCTVTITTDGTGYWNAYAATVLDDDGTITYRESHVNSMSADTLTGPITIQNCVCGSTLFVSYSAVMPGVTTDDLILVFNRAGSYIIQAPTTAGASATITFYDAD